MAADTPPDPTRHRRIKSVFLAALALPESERAAFLDERCASDAAMRAEVDELLRLERGGGATLEAGFGLREAIEELREEPLPERIGPYRPIRLLGRGGMGEVYLAEKDGEDGSRYAVKRINAQSLNAEGRGRFKREAAILARLDHPGIARVLDTGESGEGRAAAPYLVMEFVDGVPLGRWAAERAPSTRDRITMLARIADAVQHAHAQGIVHRDLKPENILVTAEGEPKVLDFGVARLVEGDERPTERMTRTGWLVGTPQYMSPEQVQAEAALIGPPSDVYALGVIGYELLSGRVPYEASRVSLHRAVVAILTVEPPTLGTLSRELGGPAERVIAKCIHKMPAERYANAGDLAADLRRLLAGRTVHARGPGLARRLTRFAKRRRAVSAVVASVLAIAVLGAAWEWGRTGAPSRVEVDGAYHRSQDEMATAYPLLYSIPRVPERVEKATTLLESALARVRSLPPRSYSTRLEHALELYLGTARLIQAEWAWDVAGFDEARGHLIRAEALPLDDPNWDRDGTTAEAHTLLADLDPVNTVSLLGGSSMQLANLRGVAGPLMDSWHQRRAAMDLTRRLHGPPPEATAERPLAMNEPWVFRFNDFAEACVVRAEFSGSPGMAATALAYTDSAWARRAALQANDSALGSVVTLRARAFLVSGRIANDVALVDSALAYFRRGLVYRGPERPVVFAESNRWIAEALLVRAAMSPAEKRPALLSQASSAAHSAVLALTDSTFARDLAESRSQLVEVLIERSRATAQGAYLDSVQTLLVANGEVFSPALTPRAYRHDQLLRARRERALWELTHDESVRSMAVEMAARVRDLGLLATDSLMLREGTAELAALGAQ